MSQGRAFAFTGQPRGGALSMAMFSFRFHLKDVHLSLFILNFLIASNTKRTKTESVNFVSVLNFSSEPKPILTPTCAKLYNVASPCELRMAERTLDSFNL